MTYLMARLDVPDFDTWKRETFDHDPAGRAKSGGKGHRICRGAEHPNEVIVQLEFSSAEQAKAFRQQLNASGALDHVGLAAPPVIVEETETVTY
jgi:hypothetical protein